MVRYVGRPGAASSDPKGSVVFSVGENFDLVVGAVAPVPAWHVVCLQDEDVFDLLRGGDNRAASFFKDNFDLSVVLLARIAGDLDELVAGDGVLGPIVILRGVDIKGIYDFPAFPVDHFDMASAGHDLDPAFLGQIHTRVFTTDAAVNISDLTLLLGGVGRDRLLLVASEQGQGHDDGDQATHCFTPSQWHVTLSRVQDSLS